MAAPSPHSADIKRAFELFFDARRLLEEGYMTYFKAEEKLDLAESLLRNIGGDAVAGQPQLVIKVSVMEASINGSHIPLSPAQLKLMNLLNESPGMTGREELQRLMNLNSHGLSVLMNKLKAKLRDAGFPDVIIQENNAYRLRKIQPVTDG
ncbi:MAG TPA: hypothetical protein DIT64_20355 [Verrucomicrobiales bacterium]|nr:hypothetical protein [Verrucomicrobiales bacterium]